MTQTQQQSKQQSQQQANGQTQPEPTHSGPASGPPDYQPSQDDESFPMLEASADEVEDSGDPSVEGSVGFEDGALELGGSFEQEGDGGSASASADIALGPDRQAASAEVGVSRGPVSFGASGSIQRIEEVGDPVRQGDQWAVAVTVTLSVEGGVSAGAEGGGASGEVSVGQTHEESVTITQLFASEQAAMDFVDDPQVSELTWDGLDQGESIERTERDGSSLGLSGSYGGIDVGFTVSSESWGTIRCTAVAGTIYEFFLEEGDSSTMGLGGGGSGVSMSFASSEEEAVRATLRIDAATHPERIEQLQAAEPGSMRALIEALRAGGQLPGVEVVSTGDRRSETDSESVSVSIAGLELMQFGNSDQFEVDHEQVGEHTITRIRGQHDLSGSGFGDEMSESDSIEVLVVDGEIQGVELSSQVTHDDTMSLTQALADRTGTELHYNGDEDLDPTTWTVGSSLSAAQMAEIVSWARQDDDGNLGDPRLGGHDEEMWASIRASQDEQARYAAIVRFVSRTGDQGMRALRRVLEGERFDYSLEVDGQPFPTNPDTEARFELEVQALREELAGEEADADGIMDRIGALVEEQSDWLTRMDNERWHPELSQALRSDSRGVVERRLAELEQLREEAAGRFGSVEDDGLDGTILSVEIGWEDAVRARVLGEWHYEIQVEGRGAWGARAAAERWDDQRYAQARAVYWVGNVEWATATRLHESWEQTLDEYRVRAAADPSQAEALRAGVERAADELEERMAAATLAFELVITHLEATRRSHGGEGGHWTGYRDITPHQVRNELGLPFVSLES